MYERLRTRKGAEMWNMKSDDPWAAGRDYALGECARPTTLTKRSLSRAEGRSRKRFWRVTQVTSIRLKKGGCV